MQALKMSRLSLKGCVPPYLSLIHIFFQDLPQDDGYQRTTTGSEAYLLSGGATPIYVGMSNDFFKQSMADYAQTYRAYLITVIFMVVCIVIFAGAFIWLLYTAGRSPRNDDVKVGFMDSIYLDIGGICLLYTSRCV